MKNKKLILVFSLITFALLSSGFINFNSIVGTWVLSKSTYQEMVNNNTIFDTVSNHGSHDMVINFDTAKYTFFANDSLSDSSSYRITDDYLFFNSIDMIPNHFQIEKLTADSLVLYLESSYYINNDSISVNKRRLHFYRRYDEF